MKIIGKEDNPTISLNFKGELDYFMNTFDKLKIMDGGKVISIIPIIRNESSFEIIIEFKK